MSIIRADSIKNRSGAGAPDFPNGITVTGIVTATTLNSVANNVDVDDFISVGNNIHLGNAGVCTATPFSGSGASLTSLPAAQITGTLPAIDGSNLTGISGGIGAVNQGRLTTASQLANVAGDFSVNLSTSITPTKAGSKILVMASVSSGSQGGTSAGYVFKLYRSIGGGSYAIVDGAGGDAAGSRSRAFLTGGQEHGTDWVSKTAAYNFLDTPSYSLGQSVEYLIYAGGAGGQSRVINRNWRDADTTDNPRCMSSITIMDNLQ